MLDGSRLALFVAATIVLLVTPGPAVLYIVAQAIDQGRLGGIISVLGLEVGTLFHVVAAALGVSALLMSSALAFNVVKYAGAAYLIYLGLRTLLGHPKLQPVQAAGSRKTTSIFYQGVLVNLLNPKTALFFFAFLPQFVDPKKGGVVLQILFLGFVFVILAIVSDSTYALLAGTLGQWLKHNLGFLRAQRYFAGIVYIALGVTTALSGSEKK